MTPKQTENTLRKLANEEARLSDKIDILYDVKMDIEKTISSLVYCKKYSKKFLSETGLSHLTLTINSLRTELKNIRARIKVKRNLMKVVGKQFDKLYNPDEDEVVSTVWD